MDDELTQSRIRAAYRAVDVPRMAPPLLDGRRSARRDQLPRVVGAGMILAVAVIAVGVWLVGQGQPTVLGWQAVPQIQDAALLANAANVCAVVPDASKGPRADLPVVIVDARGQTAVAFMTDGRDYETCEFTLDENGARSSASMGIGGQLGLGGSLDVITGRTDGAGRYHLIVGHVPAGTATVHIDVANGEPTTASLGGGYYLAWWPDLEALDGVTALNAQGVAIATITPPIN
ncbi:MAG: hypothetical protein ACXWZX_18735 [Mycobacterium sp.]